MYGMPRKIKISTTALKDITNGIDYYKSKQKGLGIKFEKIVHTTFKSIQKSPACCFVCL